MRGHSFSKHSNQGPLRFVIFFLSALVQVLELVSGFLHHSLASARCSPDAMVRWQYDL